MGTRAERFSGYFRTSASNRAANLGEKRVMVSVLVFLGLIASTPVPTVRRPYPALHRPRFPVCPNAIARPQLTPSFHSVHLRASSLQWRPRAVNPAKHCRDALESDPHLVRQSAQPSPGGCRSTREPRCSCGAGKPAKPKTHPKPAPKSEGAEPSTIDFS